MTDEYVLQFFRDQPGDLGITDLTDQCSDDDLEQTLPYVLLTLRSDPDLAFEERPIRARALSADGDTVISEIEVVRLDRVTLVAAPTGEERPTS